MRPLSRPFLVKRVAALGSGRWWFQGHWQSHWQSISAEWISGLCAKARI